MRHTQTGLLLAVLVSTVAVSAQQASGDSGSPADIIYAQAGQLVDAVDSG